MKRLRIFLLAVLVFGLGYGATSVVAQVGAVLYKNSATGRSYPQQISAGYLATADGGVVNVMSGPAPTAVGRALRTTSIGTGTNQTVAAFTTDPAATTTGAGVDQLSTATPPLVSAGPGAVGTGTAVLREGQKFGLTSSNPTQGKWFVAHSSTIGTNTVTDIVASALPAASTSDQRVMKLS